MRGHLLILLIIVSLFVFGCCDFITQKGDVASSESKPNISEPTGSQDQQNFSIGQKPQNEEEFQAQQELERQREELRQIEEQALQKEQLILDEIDKLKNELLGINNALE